MIGIFKVAYYSVVVGAGVGAVGGFLAGLCNSESPVSITNQGVTTVVTSQWKNHLGKIAMGSYFGALIPFSFFYETTYVCTNLFLHLIFNQSAPLQFYHVSTDGLQTGWKDRRFMWKQVSENEIKIGTYYRGARLNLNL